MGRKKKSVANKLAKMSDEERARYLQHKADMEEEARRRKEQLISTFMKNKMRKEDAFSRLNLAKINQHWHQILRKMKCNEMKENVEHMRKWIDRVIALKNRTIDKLMEELDEAELQYGHNLKYHIRWIDKIIESHNTYLKKLRDDYDEDLLDILDTSSNEQKEYIRKCEEDQNHLKTIMYGQDDKMQDDMKSIEERFIKKHDEIVCMNQMILEKTVKDRELMLSSLWQQVAQVVKQYVQYTDLKRAHFAELKRLDAESSAEIAINQDNIMNEEQLIIALKNECEVLTAKRNQDIRAMEEEIQELKVEFSKMRRLLHTELSKDDKRLRQMTDISNQSIKYLENVAHKGDQIKFLIKACSKLETDEDKISKYLPVEEIEIPEASAKNLEGDYEESEATGDNKASSVQERLVAAEKTNGTLDEADILVDTGSNSEDISYKKPTSRPKTSFIREIQDKSSKTEFHPPQKAITTTHSPAAALYVRPKTSFMKKLHDAFLQRKQSPSSSGDDTEKTKSEDRSHVREVIIKEKNPKPTTKHPFPPTPTPQGSAESLTNCFNNLRRMEKFWSTYNKVELDCMELKAEKTVLSQQNKQLRGMLRSVLEAAALARTIPNSRVSTRVASRIRTARSAPPGRLVF